MAFTAFRFPCISRTTSSGHVDDASSHGFSLCDGLQMEKRRDMRVVPCFYFPDQKATKKIILPVRYYKDSRAKVSEEEEGEGRRKG